MFTITKGQQKTSACDRFFRNGKNDDVFTPLWLAELMWDKAKKYMKAETPVILDPCCGDGGILQGIPKEYHKNITAIDNNEEYINTCKEKYPYINTVHANFLTIRNSLYTDYNIQQPNIVLINPPFSLKKGKHNVPFWDECLNMLTNDGIMVSICPDYYILNSEKRKKLYTDSIIDIQILPKFCFDTNGDGKADPFFTFLVTFVKSKINAESIFIFN